MIISPELPCYLQYCSRWPGLKIITERSSLEDLPCCGSYKLAVRHREDALRPGRKQEKILGRDSLPGRGGEAGILTTDARDLNQAWLNAWRCGGRIGAKMVPTNKGPPRAQQHQTGPTHLVPGRAPRTAR